jgi:hypothetical protein
MKLAIVAAVLLFAAFTWGMWSAERQAHNREAWAENSSMASLRFTAAGLWGETFVVVESQSNSVNCDSYLDLLLHDSEVSPKIRRMGFTKVSCGGETRDLR